MQKMAKRAKLTTEQVLEGWENFEEEVEDREELDTIREPVMPGSDDEFSDFEEMLAEEEEDNHERVETEIVQEVQREEREESESVCMEEDNMGTLAEEQRTDDDTNGVDTTQSLPPPLPRDGATWSAPGTIPPVHPFTSPVGPTSTIPDSPLDAFLLTFTPDLIAMIVRESNRYAGVLYPHGDCSRSSCRGPLEARSCSSLQSGC
jgi:hypothetical protein